MFSIQIQELSEHVLAAVINSQSDTIQMAAKKILHSRRPLLSAWVNVWMATSK